MNKFTPSGKFSQKIIFRMEQERIILVYKSQYLYQCENGQYWQKVSKFWIKTSPGVKMEYFSSLPLPHNGLDLWIIISSIIIYLNINLQISSNFTQSTDSLLNFTHPYISTVHLFWYLSHKGSHNFQYLYLP